MQAKFPKINIERVKDFSESVLFSWPKVILGFMYFVLFLVLIQFAYIFTKEYVEYLFSANKVSAQMALNTLLEFMDMLMIANLGYMVITGSYNSFISKDHKYKGEIVGSGLLKVKMSSSAATVVSIVLVKAAIIVGAQVMHLEGFAYEISWSQLIQLGFIYLLLIYGTHTLALVDNMHMGLEIKTKKTDKQAE